MGDAALGSACALEDIARIVDFLPVVSLLRIVSAVSPVVLTDELPSDTVMPFAFSISVLVPIVAKPFTVISRRRLMVVPAVSLSVSLGESVFVKWKLIVSKLRMFCAEADALTLRMLPEIVPEPPSLEPP